MFTFPTSLLVFLLAVQQKGREKGDEHGGVFVSHCTENPIYVFLFWELRDLSPNFHVHVVSDLYFRRIGPHTVFPAAELAGRWWEYIVGAQDLIYNSAYMTYSYEVN